MFEDNFLEAASSYAKTMATKYDIKIQKYSAPINYGEDAPPVSLLGMMTVGIVTFMISMIVNFIKFIMWTIKTLVVDSEIIPTIVNGIASLAESHVVKYSSIKVAKTDDFYKFVNDLGKIIKRRSDVLSDNDKGFDVLWYSIDPDITKGLKPIKDYSDIINDEKLKNKYLDHIKSGYKKLHNTFKYENAISRHYETLSGEKAHKEALSKYKNLLVQFDNTILKPNIEYYEKLQNKMEDIEKSLRKLEKKIDDATFEDRAFYIMGSELIPTITVDMKRLSDTISWLKNEIVSNMLIITNNM